MQVGSCGSRIHLQKLRILRERIATELVDTTRDSLKRNIPVSVEFSWGAGSKTSRLVDAIVDITETGSSLRVTGSVSRLLLETCTVIIANKDAWKDTWKRNKLENLKMLLQGTLDAENYIGLKCNVQEANLEKS